MGGDRRGDGSRGRGVAALARSPVLSFDQDGFLEYLPGGVRSSLSRPGRRPIPCTIEAVPHRVAAPLRSLQIPSAKNAAHRYGINKVSVSRTPRVRTSLGHLQTASSAPVLI
jgi:hypothetical protein